LIDRDALEALRRRFDGIALTRHLWARLVELDAGRSRLVVDPPATGRNPNGAVNGGVLAAIIDITGGFAVAATVPGGENLVTTDLSIHYMRAARALPVVAEAEVIRRGRRAAFVRIDVRDAEALCATATGTWLVGSGADGG
jgi:uncharacterized protein (TIGR00369 family)